ncbi:sugar ABC transporter permease [Polymorphobacter sp. PAMC 29334]|uniref:carbohydrate ABC transporter permease n=1 Tax=Polymorphobacter sp. PAMC 29334 TaxID=2862331 RepID=UPI001C677DC9|nr:sugar ABC transporter permease [Polymorphobacter sp. PAMC 29334]QYE34987.1 sugar ABC transporter permease [Polymorphobacter sp. PAMC 29334]
MTRRRSSEARAGLAFTLPVLFATLAFLVVPTVAGLLLSLTDFDIYALADLANLRLVGGGNYLALAHEPRFWQAVSNTLVFAGIGVPAAIGTSLATALLLDSATVGWKPVWRLLLFAPYVTTLVATALVWRYVLDTRSGLLNAALGVVGIAPVDWLGDPKTSIPATLIFIVWKAFGYNMLVFTAALATVSTDLREAARLDGAGPVARFRHVTLPAIGPALILASVLSVANFLQVFAEPYVMTHGGPAQSTTTILYFMFDEGFTWWNLGTASAVAVILFVAILGLTAVQARLARRMEWL